LRGPHNLFRFLAVAPLAGFVSTNGLSPPQVEASRPRSGFQSSVQGVQDIDFDVLREFWPEVSRKFNLPFRGSRETETAGKAAAIY
jgi:hypothetical protein